MDRRVGLFVGFVSQASWTDRHTNWFSLLFWKDALLCIAAGIFSERMILGYVQPEDFNLALKYYAELEDWLDRFSPGRPFSRILRGLWKTISPDSCIRYRKAWILKIPLNYLADRTSVPAWNKRRALISSIANFSLSRLRIPGLTHEKDTLEVRHLFYAKHVTSHWKFTNR